MFRGNTPAALLLLASSLLSGTAFAQQAAPGVIDRGTEELPLPEGFGLGDDIPAPLYPEPELDSLQASNEIIATLSSIEFMGSSVIKSDELQKASLPYIGSPLTKDDIARLKYDLTALFYDRGHILVKVTTPPQDISDGTLLIKIYEARVGEIHIHDSDDTLSSWVSNSAASLVEPGTVFQERSVETMVSDLNDLKNVEAHVTLKPGPTFGTTDLHVTVNKAEEDSYYAQVDNYGNELTGKNVATVYMEKSNLLSAGETIHVTARRSDDELWSANVGIKIPTPINNVNFEADYLYSHNDIGDRLAAQSQEGTTNRASVALSKNLINTRDQKVNLRGGLEARRHKTTIFGQTDSVDDIRQAFIDLSYLQRTTNSVWYAAARLTKGLDGLGANKDHPNIPLLPQSASSSRLLGDPYAAKFEPTLLGYWRPFDNSVFKLLIRGQLASSTLLSSDLFVLGGYGSVRGFEPAEEVGESGFSFTTEYSHELPIDEDWTVTMGPWFDGGAIFNRLEGQAQDNHLYSAGLGLEASTDLIPVGETMVRLDWAHPLGAYASPDVNDDTVYFRIKQIF